MEKPKISWHVLEMIDSDEYEFIQCKTYNEEGSHIPGEYISKTIQVWNNYAGNNTVQNAKDCKLVVSFKNYEDNILLGLIRVQVNGNDEEPLTMDIDRGVIDIGSLSGIANNGSELNVSNYSTIHLTIGPIPENIKSELKSMYFYLEYNPDQE